MVWHVGAPIRAVLLGSIRVYQLTVSGWLGGQCRFYPSCSAYAEVAIRGHGAAKGSLMAVWRVLRCNPFGAGGVDHVEPAPARGERYEGVTLKGVTLKGVAPRDGLPKAVRVCPTVDERSRAIGTR
jgi:putative membrane protein insertion efficiency factor